MTRSNAALLVCLLLAVVASAVGAAGPAQATFPGQNGKIAFVQFGDIYSMNADGSEVTRLTYSGGSAPTYSPDGSKIAFTRRLEDRSFEIFVMNADGSGQENLTNHPANDVDPTWSPDGKKIAFVSSRDGKSEIYLMDVVGGSERPATALTDTPSFEVEEPAWSPDGGKLEFVVRERLTNTSDIHAIDASGANQENLTHTSDYDEYDPDWSPDGEKLAYERSGGGTSTNLEIFVMNADGSSPEQLTFSSEPNGYYCCKNHSPAWSPDGERVAFVNLHTIYRNHPARQDRPDEDIHIIDADGSNMTKLEDPDWSADDPDWGVFFDAGPPPPPDTTPPSVLLTAPAAIVGGAAVTLSAKATDDTRLSRVEFSIRDGDSRQGYHLGTDETAPFSITWETEFWRDGRKTIIARAVDAAGNASTDDTRSVILNNHPPDVKILSKPAETTSETWAYFSFYSTNEDAPAFYCSLDGSSFVRCTSPHEYGQYGQSYLDDGRHTFRVYAVGAAGAAQDTGPTTGYTWTVEASAPTVPDTMPADGAARVSRSTDVTATFSEAMDASTLNGASVKLTKQVQGKQKRAQSGPVAAVVRYNPDTRTVTVDPEAKLPRGTYTATITTGAKDVSGRALAADKVWSFTV